MKKGIIAVLLGIALPLSAGAWSIDATGGGEHFGGDPSWTHVNNGNLLVVTLQNGLFGEGFAGVVTCTYAGTSMGKIGYIYSGAKTAYMFWLKNPATGSNTVACDSPLSVNTSGASVSYADMPTNFNIVATTSAIANNVSITSTTTGALIVGAGSTNDNTSMTAGTNTTINKQQADLSNANTANADMGTYPTAPGPYTITLTNALAIVAAVFDEPDAPAAPQRRALKLGSYGILKVLNGGLKIR